MSYDLINEIGQKSRMLDALDKELKMNGQKLAAAEHDYRIALADKLLEERAKGTPITICPDICRGDRKVAKLRLERDTLKVVYQQVFEAINIQKLQIKILNAQIEREWGRAARN